MIGEHYWSLGIVLRYHSSEVGWSAECDFFDDGFCQVESTEGFLCSRYYGPIEIVIDNVKSGAEKLGIEWRHPALFPYKSDEDKRWPMPPDWREILREQADRIGWSF